MEVVVLKCGSTKLRVPLVCFGDNSTSGKDCGFTEMKQVRDLSLILTTSCGSLNRTG